MKYRDAMSKFVNQYSNIHTRTNYEQGLSLFAKYLGEERDVSKITTMELVEAINEIRTNYRYSEATFYKYIKFVKIFFNWLHKMKVISENPAAPIRNRTVREAVARQKAMTDEELALILRLAYPDPVKHAIVLFLADTGCRAGGVATLRMDKLNLAGKKAEVLEKGDKTRTVWFEADCAEALHRWLHKRQEVIDRARELGYITEDHGYVFCHSKGHYLPDAISQIIKRLGQEAGIDRPLGSHALRHRKGHQLADAGVAPSVAANVLGHTDVGITLRFYYPKDDERAEEAARRLGYRDEQKPSRIIKFRK